MCFEILVGILAPHGLKPPTSLDRYEVQQCANKDGGDCELEVQPVIRLAGRVYGVRNGVEIVDNFDCEIQRPNLPIDCESVYLRGVLP